MHVWMNMKITCWEGAANTCLLLSVDKQSPQHPSGTKWSFGRGFADKRSFMMTWSKGRVAAFGVHTYAFVHTHTHTHTNIYVFVQTYMHTYTYILKRSFTRTHARTHARTHTHTHTHAHIYVFVQRYMHTHTHTHTHARSLCVQVHDKTWYIYMYVCVYMYIHRILHTTTYSEERSPILLENLVNGTRTCVYMYNSMRVSLRTVLFCKCICYQTVISDHILEHYAYNSYHMSSMLVRMHSQWSTGTHLRIHTHTSDNIRI